MPSGPITSYHGENAHLVPVEAFTHQPNGLEDLAVDLHGLARNDSERAVVVGAFGAHTFLSDLVDARDLDSAQTALNYLHKVLEAPSDLWDAYVTMFGDNVVGLGERFPSAYTVAYAGERPQPKIAFRGLQRLFVSAEHIHGQAHRDVTITALRGLAEITERSLGGLYIEEGIDPIPVIRAPHAVEGPENNHAMPLLYTHAGFYELQANAQLLTGNQRLPLPGRSIFIRRGTPA